MADLTEISCPSCGKTYRVPPSPKTRSATCQGCNQSIEIPASRPAAASQPVAAPQPVSQAPELPPAAVASAPMPQPMALQAPELPPAVVPPAEIPMAVPLPASGSPMPAAAPQPPSAPAGPLPPHLAGGGGQPAAVAPQFDLGSDDGPSPLRSEEMKQRYTKRSGGMGLILAIGAAVLVLLAIGGLFALYVSQPDLFHETRTMTMTDETGGERRIVDGGEAKIEWANAMQKSVVRNDVKVGIDRVWIGPIRARNANNAVESSGTSFLQVYVEMQNLGDQPVNYTSWYGNEFTSNGQAAVATLRDNTGAPYPMMTFGDVVRLEGHISEATLSTRSGGDNEASDVIIYELPEGVDPNEVKFFQLELPDAAVGGDGWIRFQIPIGMVQDR